MVSASIARYRQGAGSITTAASPTWRTESIVGGSYDFGSFKLAGGYMEHRTPGGNLSAAATVGGAGASPFAFSWDKMKMAYIGAAIPLPVGKFSFDVSRLQYHYAAMPDGKAWAFGSVYEYPLSKRTSLYASYGHINNDSRSRTPLFATVVAIVNTGFGSKPSAFSVGMQHIF
jgi:predicted porin